ncbi:MAG: hypothetical protein AB8B50_04045 [Pirellulaceae bacterium]
MDLILPKKMLNQAKTRATYYGHYVSASEITGSATQVSDLLQKLAVLKKDDVLRQVAHLLQLLVLYPHRPAELDGKLLPRYLTDEQRLQVANYLQREPGGIVFHKQGLWQLLQFAATSCSDSVASIDEAKLRLEIGLCALLSNDLIDDDNWPADANEDESKLDDAITTALLPTREIGSSHQDVLDLYRFKTLWFDLPQTEDFRRRVKPLKCGTNWHEAFASAQGLELEHFATICAICVSFFMPDQSNTNPKRMDLDSYFGHGTFRAIADSVFALIAQTTDELARSLINEPRQSWSRDFTAIKKRPLLWVEGGYLVCAEFSFLVELLRTGIYYYLVAAYGQHASSFQQCFGYAFELYVEDKLAGIAHPGTVLVRELYPSPNFHGTKDEICDFLIDWPNVAVLAECKASLLTAKQKYSGDRGVLLKGIDDQFVGKNTNGKRKGVTQLAHSINRLIAGEKASLSGDDVTPDPAKPIIPMLIAYDPTVGYHSVRGRLQRKLDAVLSPAAQQSGRVLPLVILTIDELERLQALSNAAPARGILLNYSRDIESGNSTQLGSFNHYLWDQFPDARVAHDSSMRNDCHRLMQQVEASFRAAADCDDDA